MNVNSYLWKAGLPCEIEGQFLCRRRHAPPRRLLLCCQEEEVEELLRRDLPHTPKAPAGVEFVLQLIHTRSHGKHVVVFPAGTPCSATFLARNVLCEIVSLIIFSKFEMLFINWL